MSNSSLVNYKKISPNSTNPRNNKIDRITIHHMAGNLSVESCGEVFATTTRQASSNYGVGSDGRIGLYVEEKNRSWCSSSRENDNRAVTIEVANDGGAPDWHVSDKALAATIDLCVDICKRNGIKKLNYTGDTSGNLTMHKWFTNTSCPGPYLGSKFPYIAEEVNKRLGVVEEKPVTKPVEPENTDKGVPYLYTVKGDDLYIYKGASVTSGTNGKIKPGIYTIVKEVTDGAKKWGKLKSGAGWILLSETVTEKFNSYLVQVKRTDLNIRKGAGTNYGITGIIKPGVYTIVAEANGAGSDKGWGKLKSGAGWISLDYCTKL